ncbi:hypothetical protein D3C73_1605610 [compost metagenome]
MPLLIISLLKNIKQRTIKTKVSLISIIAGIEIPIPVLITKIGIFILLSIFVIYFNNKYYKNITQ